MTQTAGTATITRNAEGTITSIECCGITYQVVVDRFGFSIVSPRQDFPPDREAEMIAFVEHIAPMQAKAATRTYPALTGKTHYNAGRGEAGRIIAGGGVLYADGSILYDED